MRINTTQTKVLRLTHRIRYLLDIVLHPMLMPTYVVLTTFTRLFPYSTRNGNTLLLILLYLVSTFIAPIVFCHFTMHKMRQRNLWRPQTLEGSLIVMIYSLIFYASVLIFYRNIFFLPFMRMPIIIAIALITCRLLTLSRHLFDMHTASLCATITYIYQFTFRCGIPPTPPVYLLIILGGMLAYFAFESHRTTLRQLLFGALTGIAISLSCSLLFQ